MLRAGALGDFLLGIPALRALRNFFPTAQVVLVGPLPQARFALAAGVAGEVLSIGDPALAPLFDDNTSLSHVPAGLRELDLAVVWLGRGDAVAANLRRLGGREVIAAPPYGTAPGAPHVADWLLQTLAPLGVRPDPDWEQTPWLSVPDEARRWTVEWQQQRLGTRDYVVLHPGSGSRRKNWPAERWSEVACTLHSGHELALVVTTGPADGEALAATLGAMGAAHGRRRTAGGGGRSGASGAVREPVVVRDLDLFQLAALLERARLYLGNDSGVTHLAAGLGTPAVAVFGPTNPDLWRPRGPRVRVLGGNRQAGIAGVPLIANEARWPEAEDVILAARDLLAHRPGAVGPARERPG